MRATILVLVMFAGVLSYESSHPRAYYERAKSELREANVEVFDQIHEKVMFTNWTGGRMGASLDMGAYGGEFITVISIDRRMWSLIDHQTRRKLIMHEAMHSLFDEHHCMHRECMMIQGMNYKQTIPYDVLFDTALKMHNFPRKIYKPYRLDEQIKTEWNNLLYQLQLAAPYLWQ